MERRADLGDIVRIRIAPETLTADFADRIGTCFGFTTPSVTGVVVIGQTADDALNVGFDDGTSAWFDPSLVIVTDVNAGQVAIVGPKRLVRASDGAWMESPESRIGDGAYAPRQIVKAVLLGVGTLAVLAFAAIVLFYVIAILVAPGAD